MNDSRRLDALRDLLRARVRLASVPATECVRLCAGLRDGVPGMLVDRFGPLVVAVDYGEPDGEAPPREELRGEALLGLVRACFPDHHAVVKVRAMKVGARGDGTNRFLTTTYHPEGSVLPLLATERGLTFELGLDPAHDFGLFLDAAKARLFVRENARGRRVLNLFSYTGAFGIAAAAGGAVDVVNVDPNRDYLAWSLRNAELNRVAMRVLPDTAQDYMAKHLRRRARDPHHASPDLVIVDPPAFGVGRGNERVLRLLWPQLFASLRAIGPALTVLMCNDKSFRSRTSFADLVKDELGALYTFDRLGTQLSPDEHGAKDPALGWGAAADDPAYVEPVVLVGSRRSRSGALSS